MTKTATLKVGDLVQINRGKRRNAQGRWVIDTGDTVWEITDVASDGLRCFIREAGTRHLAQVFDTSLLVPARK